MRELPAPGTRVAVRYRLPAGSAPPLTDVIGRLLGTDPVLVQTRTGAVVQVAPADVVAVRALTAAPVRTSQIRATEHAAALAWPGTEQHWLSGWLLRAAGGHTRRGNSAVPLGVEAGMAALPAIVDWYRERGLTARLAVPDRLLRLPASPEFETVVLMRDLPAGDVGAVTFAAQPDDDWLRLYRRDVPAQVLTSVVAGQVTFGRVGEAAVGRAAVTDAPDGARWVGVSAARVAEEHRRRGHARTLCTGLLAWGAARGATHAYVQVLADNAAALGLYEALGFGEQHRTRYFTCG